MMRMRLKIMLYLKLWGTLPEFGYPNWLLSNWSNSAAPFLRGNPACKLSTHHFYTEKAISENDDKTKIKC